jgi:predicted flap endonuclease-1-like 5' DNA nuclease
VNGITLLALLVLVVGLPLAFRAGIERGRRDPRNRSQLFRPSVAAPNDVRPREAQAVPAAPTTPMTEPVANAKAAPAVVPGERLADTDEHARIVRASAAETFALRTRLATGAAAQWQLDAFASDRHALQRNLAAARTEVAHYRQLIVELEDNAPPPLLDGPNAPDDLKLIVGVGPVIERLLQKIGIGTYRQIARWSEHDIDDFDARLPEFHGRIRRDAWVTQARELHQSKYGERP